VLDGTYRLERTIGHGGMGAVYEARHTRLPRRFAVKVLSVDFEVGSDIFQRFQREAEIAGSLGHESIVQVFDFNVTSSGIPYMVMELLEGEDLSARLKSVGRLSLGETALYLEHIAGGLAVAHSNGIVHRDLKPQNIFLCRRPGRPDLAKILDFGVSKISDSTSMATRTGALLGTPNYMSPEQADGRPPDVDHRTDIFALGSILYEMLCGHKAFEGATMMGTLFQICKGTPLPLRERVPDLPAAVEVAIGRALARDKAARTPSAPALLEEFVAGCPADLLDAFASGSWSTITGATRLRPPAGARDDSSAPTSARDDSSAPTVRSTATTVAVPESEVPAGAGPTTLGSVASEVVEPGEKQRPRWRAAAIGAGVLVAAVAVYVAVGSLRGGPEPSAPSANEVSDREPASTPDLALVGSEATAPTVRAAPAPEPEAPPAPVTVQIELVLDPPGARVELNGIATEQNPLEVPRSTEPNELRVSAKGYATTTRLFRPTTDGNIRVTLKRRHPPRSRRKPPEKTRPPSTKPTKQPKKPRGLFVDELD